ncbi:MAG: serine protease [Thermoanaerobaculales bacterium]|nr:serine protease [Thermoanaerobaculales bacterium]
MISIRTLLVVLVLVTGLVPVGSGEFEPKALEQAMDSAVFIKTNRVFRGQYFPSSGSGFFVHPEGFVLTNWHVVSDQIMANVYGDQREISTKVLGLEVVVNSGARQERVLKAKIVALDRDRDLALLKVRHEPEVWLDLAGPEKVHLTEKVWIVGYPLGELVAVGRERENNSDVHPEVSINTYSPKTVPIVGG